VLGGVRCVRSCPSVLRPDDHPYPPVDQGDDHDRADHPGDHVRVGHPAEPSSPRRTEEQPRHGDQVEDAQERPAHVRPKRIDPVGPNQVGPGGGHPAGRAAMAEQHDHRARGQPQLLVCTPIQGAWLQVTGQRQRHRQGKPQNGRRHLVRSGKPRAVWVDGLCHVVRERHGRIAGSPIPCKVDSA